MAFAVPLITAGLGALGGIFGNRPQQSQTTGNQTTQQQQGSMTMPVLSAEGAGTFDNLSQIFQQLKGGTDLSGYEAGQAQGIAGNTDILKKQAIENLAARGITTGAAPATSQTALDSSRIGQMNQLHQQIPLIQNQLLQQLLGLGTNLFSHLPEGSNTNQGGQSSTQQQGTVTQPGNILGGLFGNLGPIIAALAGMGGGGFNANPGLSPAGAAGTGGEPLG